MNEYAQNAVSNTERYAKSTHSAHKLAAEVNAQLAIAAELRLLRLALTDGGGFAHGISEAIYNGIRNTQ